MRVSKVSCFVKGDAETITAVMIDEFVSGNILIIDGNGIKTLNTQTEKSETIVGESSVPDFSDGIGTKAKFRSPADFAQHSKESLIIADSGNHCLRVVNRTTNATQTLLGNCTSFSNNLDKIDEAMFKYPHSILALSYNAYAITESKQKTLKRAYIMDRALSWRVETVMQLAGNVDGLTANPVRKDIIYATIHMPSGIEIVVINTTNWSSLTFVRSPLNNQLSGTISSKHFGNTIKIVMFNGTIMLVSDYDKNRFCVADLSNLDTPIPICTSEQSYIYNSYTRLPNPDCQIVQPGVMVKLMDSDEVLVASKNSFLLVRFSGKDQHKEHIYVISLQGNNLIFG